MRTLGCCNAESGKQNERHQTLDFDEETKTTEDTPNTIIINEEFFRNHNWSERELKAILKVQAAFRGLLARRLVRARFVDRTLASFYNESQLSGKTNREVHKMITLPDGSMYTGQVKKDPNANANEYVPDGLGKIKWPNGDRYDGEFISGKLQG